MRRKWSKAHVMAGAMWALGRRFECRRVRERGGYGGREVLVVGVKSSAGAGGGGGPCCVRGSTRARAAAIWSPQCRGRRPFGRLDRRLGPVGGGPFRPVAGPRGSVSALGGGCRARRVVRRPQPSVGGLGEGDPSGLAPVVRRPYEPREGRFGEGGRARGAREAGGGGSGRVGAGPCRAVLRSSSPSPRALCVRTPTIRAVPTRKAAPPAATPHGARAPGDVWGHVRAHGAVPAGGGGGRFTGSTRGASASGCSDGGDDARREPRARCGSGPAWDGDGR